MCGSLVCHHVYYVFYYCFVCCTYPSYFPFFFWTELSWKLIKNVYLNRGPNKLMLQCPSLLHQMYMLFINWMYFICDNKLCWTWTWTCNWLAGHVILNILAGPQACMTIVLTNTECKHLCIIIYGLIMSCKKWNNVCTVMRNCFCSHSSVIVVCISLVASQLRNKLQNNPLMSSHKHWVHHCTPYIIFLQWTSHPADYSASGICPWLSGYGAGLVSSRLDASRFRNPVGLMVHYIDGLAQDCTFSIADTAVLR